MPLSKLLFTEVHLAALRGQVEEREDYRVLRDPSNPGYYFGNLLILDQPPDDLTRWMRTFEREFGPQTVHRCLAWSGDALSEPALKLARSLGLSVDATQEMVLDSLPEERRDWEVRPLELSRDWDASVALNRASDPSERDGSASYRLFKQRLRAGCRRWIEAGVASWWGAFDGERLIAQCGLVPCGKLGRYQSVETHPAYRRQGVCGQLMTTVARDGLQRLGLTHLVLAAEVDGPALGLYERLGFQRGSSSHSLLRSSAGLQVRAEMPPDHAGVRSLVTAAFGQAQEASLIAELRSFPGALSLVADQAGSLLGQILFTPLEIKGPGAALAAVALAPVAVRPLSQGQGVGSELIQAGLRHCQAAGFELCVVIGHADYYPRFGFVPAIPLGLRNPFGVEDEHFMALELVPGAFAHCGGTLVYADAFHRL